MLPLDLDLLSVIVKWATKRIYFKFFSIKYSPVSEIVEYSNSILPNNVYYTGKISHIQDDVAYIDGLYSFVTSQLSRDVNVGDIVTCVISSNQVGVISDLTVIDILSEFEDSLEVSSCSSNTHGVITKRNDRTFTVSPGSLEFNLDDVNTKFIPEVGDVIKVSFEKNDVDNQQVISIIPQGYKVISGSISSYDGENGFINDNIVFQKHHCQPGYQPVLDDRVVLSVIRCQNGSTQFRALHVTPFNTRKRTDTFKSPHASNLNFECNNLIFSPKEIICLNLDEIKFVDAALFNNSCTEYKLVKLKAYVSESLIELVEPDIVDFCIKPKSKVLLKFKVSLKYVGFTSIIFDFIFEDFIFNCSLNLLAISKANDFVISQLDLNKNDSSPTNDKGKSFAYPVKDYYAKKAPFPGRHFKNPIKFFPVKLGYFEIPDLLVDILKDGELKSTVKKELEAYSPCLENGLKAENYKIYMHCLLYLEEYAEVSRISTLELVSGFDKKDDFMILNVEDEFNISFLQPGDKVLARKPWETEGDVYEGIIWRCNSKEFFIKFSSSFHNHYVARSEYHLSFKTGRVQVRLKHQAVDDAVNNLGIRWLFPNRISLCEPFIVEVFNESEECGSKSFNTSKKNIKWNRYGSGYGNRQKKFIIESNIPVKRKRIIKWFNGNLNFEQKLAVVNALSAETRPFPFIIFGPPGTGKTVTLVELCLQIYKLIPESRLLLVAPSNSAADQLSLNLIASGFVEAMDFTRLAGYQYFGNGKVPDGLLKYVSLPDIKGEDCLSDELPRINRYCLSEKRIIVSTLGSVGSLRTMGFPCGLFTHFIVDEAGQVTEPENLIVASLMSNDSQLILAGDHLQLGPVVLSNLAKNYGLQQSFLKRIMDFKPYLLDRTGFPDSYGYNPKFIIKLVQSYRSLPKLLCLVSNLFYRGELKPMINDSTSKEALLFHRVKDIFPPDCEVPVLFHSVSGKDVIEDGCHSFYNNEEVFQICSYLSQLYRVGIQPYNIGIISPYIAQVKKIIQFLLSLNQELPKIGSVEEFQGQEKNIILFSAVRSSFINEPHCNRYSFIFNPQRINVAISRAKSALIIVGNSTTLCNDEVWRNIVKYCVDNKSFRK